MRFALQIIFIIAFVTQSALRAETPDPPPLVHDDPPPLARRPEPPPAPPIVFAPPCPT